MLIAATVVAGSLQTLHHISIRNSNLRNIFYQQKAFATLCINNLETYILNIYSMNFKVV